MSGNQCKEHADETGGVQGVAGAGDPPAPALRPRARRPTTPGPGAILAVARGSRATARPRPRSCAGWPKTLAPRLTKEHADSIRIATCRGRSCPSIGRGRPRTPMPCATLLPPARSSFSAGSLQFSWGLEPAFYPANPSTSRVARSQTGPLRACLIHRRRHLAGGNRETWNGVGDGEQQHAERHE